MMKKTGRYLIPGILLALMLGGCEAPQPTKVAYIGADAAKALAVGDMGAAMNEVAFSNVDMKTRDGLDYYQIAFTADGQFYQYDIDALTGTIIEKQPPDALLVADADTYGPSEAAAVQEPKTGDILTEDEIREKALFHAGISAEEVTFVKSGLDWDDGRQTYDVEFYTKDHQEYDYGMDPYTGEILEFDHDAEYYAPPAADSGSAITAEQAKAKALEQVPGAALEDIWEFETDYDDGRLEYEGKIYYNRMEYEFEIDGYSGAIRSWEVESIYD